MVDKVTYRFSKPEPGDVVVDVGANKGSWSKVALAHQSDIRLFMVEAAGHEAAIARHEQNRLFGAGDGGADGDDVS